VSLRDVRWDDYDVVKTEYHRGFDTLEQFGGTDHPCIVSHLGSMVAPEDRDGIHFYGDIRARLYATQQRINHVSRYVSLLTPPARALWEECFGPRERLLVVPGAADRNVPPPGPDPYPDDGGLRVLFSGNVYAPHSQPEANVVLVDKLNRLGRLLTGANARLYAMGSGDVSWLERDWVTHLGEMPYQDTWDYFHHAHVGVVLALGPWLHNNESTKIYYYLRMGLPLVSEAGFPNDHVVRESGLGVVAENGDMEAMAQAVVDAASRSWDRRHAVQYILSRHTWDRRAEIYDRAFLQERSWGCTPQRRT
jgi:glycosyltransferase involved in cell wall biosynthesis